ncbi:MAG: CpsD/CapB family tyrosine-protein kinase [Fibrella sp.]|nr:CpsD/CapB family tyrosine-protein kinase [Armatimonadota bacterium]
MTPFSNVSRYLSRDSAAESNEREIPSENTASELTSDANAIEESPTSNPAYRSVLRQYAASATPTALERPEDSALPVHVESVAASPDAVQAVLLETQTAAISETILFHHQNKNSEEGEYRRVRSPRFGKAAQRAKPHSPSIIGVTSAVSGEGKTTVALHIALALAQSTYKNVCLIDLGLGREVLCQRLGVPPPVHGAIDVLEWDGENEPDFLPLPLLQCENIGNLYLLPAGRSPRRADKTAHSPRMGDLFAIARAWSDLIVVDLPSIASGNTLPIQGYMDGVVIVVRAGVTPKDVVAAAIEQTGRQHVMGVVLNGQESSLPGWLYRRFDKREA